MKWRWEVDAEASFGDVRGPDDGYSDSGEIEAESGGYALAELVEHGPFWDGFDSSARFTITISPVGVADIPEGEQ